MCFYLYVPIIYSMKTFRVRIVLSAAAHIVQLPQTMFLLAMEFMEYHGIFTIASLNRNIAECIFTCLLNKMVFLASGNQTNKRRTMEVFKLCDGKLNVRVAVGTCYRRPVRI